MDYEQVCKTLIESMMSMLAELDFNGVYLENDEFKDLVMKAIIEGCLIGPLVSHEATIIMIKIFLRTLFVNPETHNGIYSFLRYTV